MNATTLSYRRVDVNMPLIDWYAELFPVHVSWMRPRDLTALAKRAQALASASSLVTPQGEKLVIAAMGMLGAGFAQDPQFHALSAVLSEPLPPAEKTQAFAEAGRSLARSWLTLTEEIA